MAGSGQRTTNPPARTRRPQGGKERRRFSRGKQGNAKVTLQNRTQVVRAGQRGLTQEAVRRENHQSVFLRVSEIGEHVVERLGPSRAPLRGALVTIPQGRFVAVMSIGDDQRLACQAGRHLSNKCLIGHSPQLVSDLLVVLHSHQRRGRQRGREHLGRRPAWTGVEAEDRAQMSLARPQQRKAVVLGALEGALVWLYPARGELFETQGSEYARAPVWGSIRQSEVLRVEVERRLLLLDQHPPGEPLVPRSGRGGVTLSVSVQVEMDSVIGAAEMQRGLLLRRDHVIRRGDDLLQ